MNAFTPRPDPKPIQVLGLTQAQLTEPVCDALNQMADVIEDLRGEIGRLRRRLSDAEGLASRDVLTPALNRRGFLAELQRAIAIAQRYKIPASVVYFDLDGFKAVNDRHGHAVGDAALRAAAERLAANIREADVLGRLGGDEFAVLLLHADKAGATAKAQSLKAMVEAEPVLCGAVELRLQITFGVRQLGGADEAETALAEADAAMYLAKPSRR